ncbi:MAG: hypothetical protein OIN66_09915 [Candidatus Methanoperedens sp.]|nr:hypothetical protein [Candidatus Methanoperedens sp.]
MALLWFTEKRISALVSLILLAVGLVTSGAVSLDALDMLVTIQDHTLAAMSLGLLVFIATALISQFPKPALLFV